MLCRRLHHGNIVPVYGVGEHEGVHYYAMQFIHGHGMDAIVDDLRRLRGLGGVNATSRSDGQTLAASGIPGGSLALARSLVGGAFETARAGDNARDSAARAAAARD